MIPDTDLRIEIPTASSQTFDWTSNFDMSAILVKGSSGGIHYQYPGASDKADTGLHAVVHDETKDEMYHAISHVCFCFVVVDTDEIDEPVIKDEPKTPVDLQPAVTPPAPEVVAAQPEAIETTVLGETLVRGDTLPRTGAAATHMLALAGGLGLALGLMMLMLANRKTAVQNS